MDQTGGIRFTGLRRATGGRVGRRALVAMAVAWLPLAVLARIHGRMLGPPAADPFLLDYPVHVRFLISVPLLFLVGPLIDQRLAPVVAKIRSTLITDADRPRLEAVIGGLVRQRDRYVSDLVLFALALVDSIHIGLSVGTGWQHLESGALSPAGMWFVFVSQPLIEFLLFRWLWRILLWTLFLVRLSRLPLQLVASHPDRAGGLAFVGEAQLIFALLALPVSATGAASFARRIAYDGAKLVHFQRPIVLFVIVVFAIVLGPLLAFAPRLLVLKRRGLLEFGGFAHEYVRRFERKWVNGEEREDMLGSQDIQALADLGTSFNVVREMRVVPVDKRAALVLLVVSLLPMLVPAAVQLSVPEVVRRLLGAFVGRGG